MKVILITPPFFVPTGPAAAPALLTAILRDNGHDAVAFDVSRFCFEQLLNQSSLSRSLDRLPSDAFDPLQQQFVCTSLPYTIDGSVREIRAAATYGCLKRYGKATADLEWAMRAHAKAHGRSKWSSTGFWGNHDVNNPYSLLEAVARGGEIPDDAIVAASRIIADYRPQLIALSVSFPHQVYGAFRLARELRGLLPQSHISVGGATITRLRSAYPSLPELFSLVDSIVLREGDQAILDLAQALSLGFDPLDIVTGLIVKRGERVLNSNPEECESQVGTRKTLTMVNQSHRPRRLEHAPLPVFEDLVPGPYLGPQLLLPISTTRNCYFDKCTFCAISRSFAFGYDEMPAARMAEQIRHLAQSHNGAAVKDVSEALPPHLIADVAEELDQRGDPPAWEAYLRFENAFVEPGMAEKLRRGGLRVAYFGLESASPRLLDTMNKHIDVAVAEATIRRFADAGIWVHLFLMSGAASETQQDHDMTTGFLSRNLAHVHSIQAGSFVMELDSDIVNLSSRHRFTYRARREPTFSLAIDLTDLGDIPSSDVAHERVQEIREVAYGKTGSVLKAARHVWDGHKISFTSPDHGPQLGVASPNTSDQHREK